MNLNTMTTEDLTEKVTFEHRNEGVEIANTRTQRDSCQLKTLKPKIKILRKVGGLG